MLKENKAGEVFLKSVFSVGCLFFMITSGRVDAYRLLFTNGRQIEVTQYSIDLERDRIQFRAAATGLNYTIPLEYLETVSGESGLLFRNEKLVEARLTVDDGGIAANFKVMATSVGSSGSRSGGRAGESSIGDPQWVNNPKVSGGGYWRDDPSDRDGVGDNKNR